MFEVKNLAILLTNHVDMTLQQTLSNMCINAVTTNQRPNNNCSSQATTPNRPKRFQRNGSIQCDACKANGHCINVDPDQDPASLRICRIGGQIEHYMKFKEKFPEKAKANAELYQQMNRKVIVNYICTKFPDIKHENETLEEFQDYCEEYVLTDNLPEGYQQS